MKSLKSIILMSSLLLSTGMTNAMADDVAIIPIQKPAVLEEGTQRELTAAQIAELLPWAKDSKAFLLDLLDNTQALTMTDKVDRLIEGIKSSVIDSAPKNSELLMRYALNRAVVINEILDREMDADAVGTADAKVRVLNLSIKMALKYYDADVATLSQKTASPFAAFGKEYFSFLNELNKSIFDASAQYAIQRTSLEWLEWDLYRDLNNAQYAPQIVKINNALKTFPTKKLSDAQSISYIRQMKKINEQLNIILKAETNNSNDGDVIFGKKQEEAKPERKVRASYSTYYNKCYALSATGDVMYNSQLSDDNCFGGRYTYSTYYNKCYKVSNAGDTMYSSQVGDDNCAANKYTYNTYYNKCYKVSNAGDTMYSSQVSDDKCANGKYTYSTYYNKCYKVSNANDTMYSSPVDARYCQSN
jgi:hypothetical protein